jgi:hypothetical protein
MGDLMHQLSRSGLLAGLLGTLLLTAGCGDGSSTTGGSTAGTSATPVARVASSTTSASRVETDRYSTVEQCNEFPAALAGTFQGSVLQITPKKKAGDTWTEGVACIAMMAKPQQPLSVEVYLFKPGSEGQGFVQAEAYTKAKAPSGEVIAGWGDDARWSAGSCQLIVRYSNVVALFQQLSPVPTCRANVEPIARGYTGLHLE